ncbi:nicotinate (nicotinamide) nucleotide adenylyltransferase [Marivirga sp.]|uniref:nicotinate (nicotinamide) nucleotide adenylyltransferase n=1 Tax=Marivirga sp. TaxID=2018662 RepID=UPI002D7E9770|nr:nicotinate (nicotinamide) nucleotide adenylyltransferase [Marivirga sp.]HET8859517.1 nicotinate (nicotinamide) nucleotide adenylyltransferase [Marivirga sp.]
MNKNVGLFFGSFNPIHVGHLIIANTMLEEPDIDEVWFVVSPQSPFKTQKSLAHEFDRYDLVQAAIGDHFHMKVSDIEFKMPKPSYTADTLAYLTDQHPNHNFKLIIGQDNLKSFPKWKNSDVILSDYGLLVYPRPEAKKSDLEAHHNVRFVEAPMMDISATFIRKSIKKNRSVKYLVPDAVLDRIKGKKLYS